jgi:hypothetical protein
MYIVISFDLEGTSDVRLQAAFKSLRRAQAVYQRVVSQHPTFLVELLDVFDEFELPEPRRNEENRIVSNALFWGFGDGYKVVHSTNRDLDRDLDKKDNQ